MAFSFMATFGGDSNPLRKELRSLEDHSKRTGKKITDSLGGGIANAIAQRFGGLAAIYKIKNFIAESIRADITMQQMRSTLKSVSGSAQQAEKDISFLRAASNTIGFSFLESGRAFARFSVAANAAGLTSEETRKIFLGVQKAGVVMGLTTEQAAASMLALEQMLSKGTVMSQELRLQLGNAMPGAMNIFANALGVSQSKLYELVEDGLVPAASAAKLFGMELEKALQLTPEMNKTQRDLVKMENAIIGMKANVGEALRPEVSGGAEIIGFWASLLSSGKGKMNTLGDFIRKSSGIGIFSALGAASAGGAVEIDPYMKAAADRRTLEKLESDQKQLQQEAERRRNIDAEKAMAVKVAKVDEKTEEQRQKTLMVGATHEGKRLLLLKEINKIEGNIMIGSLTAVERAQERLDLEKKLTELAEFDRRRDRSHQMAITDWQKAGGYIPGMGSSSAVNPPASSAPVYAMRDPNYVRRARAATAAREAARYREENPYSYASPGRGRLLTGNSGTPLVLTGGLAETERLQAEQLKVLNLMLPVLRAMATGGGSGQGTTF